MTDNNKFESQLSLLTHKKSYLSASDQTQLKKLFDTDQDFYNALLEWVKHYAVAPLSHFKVAALAKESCESGGRLFFGSNLEFKFQALNMTVHGEQSSIHNAYIHGATEIQELLINATPCGHCRQFINEIEQKKIPKINVGGQSKALSEYLPYAFGPQDLGNLSPLFSQPVDNAHSIYDYFQASYAPYSLNKSACEILDKSGKSYFGVYIENAAYNPSFSPLQGAITQMQLHNREVDLSEITKIHLIQTQGAANQLAATKSLVDSLQNNIELVFEQI
jgi:cytidine deaminase